MVREHLAWQSVAGGDDNWKLRPALSHKVSQPKPIKITRHTDVSQYQVYYPI